MKKTKKPRSWHTIIKQEGAAGILKGEEPSVELAYQEKQRKKAFRKKGKKHGII